MKARRAALYVGGGAMLVAWLAAANTSTRRDPHPGVTAAGTPDRVDDVAARVREEGERLRTRLTRAPAPVVNARNPFSFAATASSSSRASAHPLPAVSESATAPILPPSLPLTLMGIAEDPSPAGPRRTAILGGTGGEIYMVTVGQTIAARYSVTAIGADAIELKDLATGGLRRLALQ